MKRGVAALKQITDRSWCWRSPFERHYSQSCFFSVIRFRLKPVMALDPLPVFAGLDMAHPLGIIPVPENGLAKSGFEGF